MGLPLGYPLFVVKGLQEISPHGIADLAHGPFHSSLPEMCQVKRVCKVQPTLCGRDPVLAPVTFGSPPTLATWGKLSRTGAPPPHGMSRARNADIKR